MRKYKKYEFCKSVDCAYFHPTNKFEKENCSAPLLDCCPYTAKEFHKWVQENGFQIVKFSTSEESAVEHGPALNCYHHTRCDDADLEGCNKKCRKYEPAG